MELDKKVQYLERKIVTLEEQMKEMKKMIERKMSVFNKFFKEQMVLQKRFNSAEKYIIEETMLDLDMSSPEYDDDEEEELNKNKFKRTFHNQRGKYNTRGKTKKSFLSMSDISKRFERKRHSKVKYENVTKKSCPEKINQNKSLEEEEEAVLNSGNDNKSFEDLIEIEKKENPATENDTDFEEEEDQFEPMELEDEKDKDYEPPTNKSITIKKERKESFEDEEEVAEGVEIEVSTSTTKKSNNKLNLDKINHLNMNILPGKSPDRVWSIFNTTEEDNKRVVFCPGCSLSISPRVYRMKVHIKNCPEVQQYMEENGLTLDDEDSDVELPDTSESDKLLEDGQKIDSMWKLFNLSMINGKKITICPGCQIPVSPRVYRLKVHVNNCKYIQKYILTKGIKIVDTEDPS